jgi:hypothetical protein
MLAMFGALVFAGAFAAVVGVFASTLVPALPRIAALLRGEADPALRLAPYVPERQLRLRVRPVMAGALASRPQSLRAAA